MLNVGVPTPALVETDQPFEQSAQVARCPKMAHSKLAPTTMKEAGNATSGR